MQIMSDDNKMMDIMGLAMGLSMASLFSQAMGKAMTGSMNQVSAAQAPLGDPVFPGQLSAVQASTPYIHAIIGGQQRGPYSLNDVVAMIRRGEITTDTYIWKPGMTAWAQAKDVTDIAPQLSITPPPVPGL